MFLDELNGLTLESLDFVVNGFIDLGSGTTSDLPCVLLQFGDYSLSVYNPMTLTSSSRSIHSNQAGFPDAIRQLIDTSVAGTRQDETAVAIDFTNGITLTISTAEADYTGPEAVVLRTPHGFVLV